MFRNADGLRGSVAMALSVAAVLSLLHQPTFAAVEEADLREALVRQLASEAPESDAVRLELHESYAGHGFAPIWVGTDGAEPKARIALAAMGDAGREGLRPADYDVDEIVRWLAEADDAAELAALEVLLSRSFVHYLSDLRTGRLAPRRVDPELYLHPGNFDRSSALERVRGSDDIGAVVAGYTPANPIYRRMRRILGEYRQLAAAGGWPAVPEGPSLKPDTRDPRIAALRRRLTASGDLTTAAAGDPELLDPALEAAVRRFQRRHGLDDDGVAGRNTLAAMNVPVERRIEQIQVNMERWRWMPDDLGDRYVLVNLAGFELDFVESGSVALHMRVVVGKTYRRSPVFSGRMTYLEFNPTWTVTPTIARLDIVPKVIQNPNYLQEQNIRVFSGWDGAARQLDPASIDWAALKGRRVPYRFRQDPGANNALGRVKFMLPNEFNVYLHDTPTRELFGRTVRAFSSGCIRLEKPLELALELLKPYPGWNRAQIDAVVATGRQKTVILPDPVPVHLTYSTVWFGEGGTIHFREDLYGRDKLLHRALFGT